MLKRYEWREKRREILESENYRCCNCANDDELSMHVHHKWYEKGKLPWEYTRKCYEVLCESCHCNETERSEETKMMIRELDYRGREHLWAFLKSRK